MSQVVISSGTDARIFLRDYVHLFELIVEGMELGLYDSIPSKNDTMRALDLIKFLTRRSSEAKFWAYLKFYFTHCEENKDIEFSLTQEYLNSFKGPKVFLGEEVVSQEFQKIIEIFNYYYLNNSNFYKQLDVLKVEKPAFKHDEVTPFTLSKFYELLQKIERLNLKYKNYFYIQK